MVIRLGRNGKFLACSLYPEHKETRPLPGEEAPKLEGDGETCPQCGEGTLDDQARPVRRLRRLLALPGLHYIRKDGPPPPGPAAVRGHLPQERRRAPHRASRPAHRERLLGVLELPEVRLHHATTSRRAPSTTSTPTARVRSSRARRGRPVHDLWRGGAAPGGRRSSGCALPGGPPDAAALRTAGARRPARWWRSDRGSARRGGRTGGAPRSGAGTRRASA